MPTIRLAKETDLSTVARLEVQLYSNPWQPGTFRSLQGKERVRILVADHPQDGVVGYAVFWWVMDQAELANLAVAQGHQGRGIGAALLDRVLQEASSLGVKSIFLEVRESNESARRLYSTRGFGQVSVRRGYYQNPREDARVLMRPLGISSVGNNGESPGTAGDAGGKDGKPTGKHL